MPSERVPDMSAGPRPLVSVVIPNHNYAAYLGQAIDSALGQSYEPVEVLVVDDGSTDGSWDIIRSYGPQVRAYRQARQGVSAARNLGIRESRGELIALLDSDDTWRRDKLERQVRLFQDAAVGMVYCLLQYVDGSGRPLGVNPSGLRGRVLKDLVLLRPPGLAASGSGAVMRRSCVDRLGGFDPELSTSADWDMWRRIACRYRIELVDEPLVTYRVHAASMHRDVARFEHDMLRAFARTFEDPAAAEVTPLRRRCYGNLYLTLAGAYLHAGQWSRCVSSARRALMAWPPTLGYLTAWPLRLLGRAVRPRPRWMDQELVASQ